MQPPAPAQPQQKLQQLYADLSVYYDRFCHDINYAEQCGYAERIFNAFNPQAQRRYLDLACGTGQHLRVMRDAGFIPQGVDNSQAMLDQAKQRCPEAQLHCCDMSAFATQPRFDLITCFLYSLHYAHPTNHVHQVLQRCWQALAEGGILLFDMVDKAGAVNHQGVTRHLQENDQIFTFASRWQYSGEGENLDLALHIERNTNGRIEIWRDTHQMTALSIQDIQKFLESLGFAVWIMERNFDGLHSWQGTSFNVVVVAQKPLRSED